MEETTTYEVRCPRCDVSFPVGTKKCLHCGGRTVSGGSAALRARRTEAREVEEWQPVQGPLGPQLEEVDEEEAEQRSRPIRALITLAWMAAAIAFSVMRACSER